MTITPEQAREQANAALAALYANVTTWDTAVLDQAIDAIGGDGRPFSANDLRDEFPDVTGPIVGARFNAAAKRGVIVDTGKRVPSTLPSTKGHEVRRWRGAQAARWSA